MWIRENPRTAFLIHPNSVACEGLFSVVCDLSAHALIGTSAMEWRGYVCKWAGPRSFASSPGSWARCTVSCLLLHFHLWCFCHGVSLLVIWSWARLCKVSCCSGFKMGSLYNNVDTYLQIGSGRVLVCSGEEARLCIISAVYQRVSCLNSEGRNSCYILDSGHLKTLSALRLWTILYLHLK
jgi:hypothetical protein